MAFHQQSIMQRSSSVPSKVGSDGPDTMIREGHIDDWCHDFFEFDDYSMESILDDDDDDDDMSLLSTMSSLSCIEQNPNGTAPIIAVRQDEPSAPTDTIYLYKTPSSEIKQQPLWCHCRTDMSRGMSSIVSNESHNDDTDSDPFLVCTIRALNPARERYSSDNQRRSSFRPFALLPNEVLSRIFNYLDVPSLVSTIQVSTRFKEIGGLDISGWDSHCEELWRGKIYVLPSARLLKSVGQSLSAYVTSYQDARFRQEITENELCYEPDSQTGTVWYFRFKDAAGPAWTTSDPWHNGEDARKLVFLRDGTIAQVVVGSDGTTTNLVSPFSDDLFLHRFNVQNVAMTWRHVGQPMDAPCRPLGAYIRITFQHRDLPTYVVHRAPVQLDNWGFIMDSCWGVFYSFPIPKQDTVMRPARRRVTDDVRWLSVLGRDSDSVPESEVDGDNFVLLLSDEALPTTTRSLWREAILYNHGATTLPEGERATREFNRLYKAFHHRFSSQPENN